MAADLVSVVIPTHNRGALLEEAIGSVLAQTYPHFEVIVVDDGSTDDTRDRVQAYGPPVRYVYQPNQGPAEARNTGIAHSRGSYVAFLDDDDLWLPRKLERQVAALKTDPAADLVYCWWSYIDQSGKILPQQATPVLHGDALTMLLDGWFVLPSGVMITRSCIHKVGPFDSDVLIGEDWIYWIRIAAAGYRFTCVREVNALNRFHGRHLSRELEKSLVNVLRVLAKLKYILPPSLWGDEMERRLRSRLLITNGCARLAAGRWDDGLQVVAEGVRLQPRVLETPQFYMSLAYYNLPPLGYRGPAGDVSILNQAAEVTLRMLVALLSRPELGVTGIQGHRAWGSCHLVLAVLYARKGCWRQSLVHLARAVSSDPASVYRALRTKIDKVYPARARHGGTAEQWMGISRSLV